MEEKNKTNTVLIVAAAAAGCLVLLCVAAAIFIIMFGFSTPFTAEEPPTETTTLSTAQLQQCRDLLAIQPDIKLEGDYYLYTPGFLDDSLECHLLARANSLEEIFDLTVVDPTQTIDQEIAPGRYLHLKIARIEPGLYRIEGFWYQT